MVEKKATPVTTGQHRRSGEPPLKGRRTRGRRWPPELLLRWLRPGRPPPCLCGSQNCEFGGNGCRPPLRLRPPRFFQGTYRDRTTIGPNHCSDLVSISATGDRRRVATPHATPRLPRRRRPCHGGRCRAFRRSPNCQAQEPPALVPTMRKMVLLDGRALRHNNDAARSTATPNRAVLIDMTRAPLFPTRLRST